MWGFFVCLIGCFFVGEKREEAGHVHLCCTSRTQGQKALTKVELRDECSGQVCAPLCSGKELRVLA